MDRLLNMNKSLNQNGSCLFHSLLTFLGPFKTAMTDFPSPPYTSTSEASLLFHIPKP